MARYKITLVLESDPDYSDGEQIEELRDEITSVVADYNCFCQIGETKVCELN